MAAALRDSFVRDEQATTAAAILRGQREIVEKQCSRSYILFLAFAAAFSLLATGTVQAFSFGGLSVSNRGNAILLLPLLAAYCAYRSAAAAALAQIIDGAIGAYWQMRLSPFARHRVTDLFTYPTPYVTEATLTNLTDGVLKKITTTWLFAMSAVICLGPVVWFVLAIFWIWSGPSHLLVRTGVFVTICLFVSRGVVLMIQFLILLYQEIKGAVGEVDPKGAILVQEVEDELLAALHRRRGTRSNGKKLEPA